LLLIFEALPKLHKNQDIFLLNVDSSIFFKKVSVPIKSDKYTFFI
jgi:hypothetical protein